MNTTANKITIFRIILIPVFMVLAYQNLSAGRSRCISSPVSPTLPMAT